MQVKMHYYTSSSRLVVFEDVSARSRRKWASSLYRRKMRMYSLKKQNKTKQNKTKQKKKKSDDA